MIQPNVIYNVLVKHLSFANIFRSENLHCFTITLLDYYIVVKYTFFKKQILLSSQSRIYLKCCLLSLLSASSSFIIIINIQQWLTLLDFEIQKLRCKTEISTPIPFSIAAKYGISLFFYFKNTWKINKTNFCVC